MVAPGLHDADWPDLVLEPQGPGPLPFDAVIRLGPLPLRCPPFMAAHHSSPTHCGASSGPSPTLASCLHPAHPLAPTQVVLVGDPKQLGPTLFSDTRQRSPPRPPSPIPSPSTSPPTTAPKPPAASTAATAAGLGPDDTRDLSLFERLANSGVPVHTLNVQYRMHPFLSEFPANYFYGDLKDGVHERDRAPPQHFPFPRHATPALQQEQGVRGGRDQEQEEQDEEGARRRTRRGRGRGGGLRPAVFIQVRGAVQQVRRAPFWSSSCCSDLSCQPRPSKITMITMRIRSSVRRAAVLYSG